MSDVDELRGELAELRGRVEAAEALNAIQNLKGTYAQLVDDRYSRGEVVDAARLEKASRSIAELFTEDGVWDGGKTLGVSTGREEIAERMRKPTLLFSWHYFLKPRIHVHGDRATARWDILSPCTTKDGTPHWMCGFEDDEYQRVDGVWLHQHMKLTSVFLSPTDKGWQKIFY